MQIVPDTNLLLRPLHKSDPLYLMATEATQLLQERGGTFVLLPQTLYEYWAVATRPATSRNGLGLTPTQAYRRIQTLLSRFALQPDPPDLLLRWQELCLLHEVRGVQAHDARLVAAM